MAGPHTPGSSHNNSARFLASRHWHRLVVTIVLALVTGCAPTEGTCATDFATTGPLVVDLGNTDVECAGRSDNLSTFVDIDFQSGTTVIGVELDDLVMGETGEFSALIVINDRDEEWRGRCPMSIEEHSLLGGSIWQLRAEVACSTLPASTGNDSPDDLTIAGGSFRIEGWHSRYEY